MTFEEFKIKCEESKLFPSLTETQKKQYSKELYRAKIFYDNNRDLYQEFIDKKDKIQTNFILPYLLGFTKELTEGTKELIQVKTGASGGIDIDTDWQGDGREKIYNYLVEKYSKDQIVHVGTFSSLGPASAAKDILRVYGIDFGESNEFTKVLQKELSWEENLQTIQAQFPNQWKFYKKHQEVIDLVPFFLDKIRQSGKHAGGIVILPKPVHNYVPVDRVNGEIVTAFPESGSEQVLDELGIVKYDILGISILDVISDCVDMVDEELYMIEDDDGITKIVPASYVDKRIESF
jgi:hypothetical protein